MAKIDWALLCDHAFLDRHEQLCVISVVRSLPAPQLPLAVHRLMLVARLVDIRSIDEVDIAVGVVTPSGRHMLRPGSGAVTIDMAREYVFATLCNIPLVEQGVHRFQIRLRGQPVVAVDIPVTVAQEQPVAAVQ